MRGQTLKIIACGGRNGLALLAQKRPRVAGSLRLHIDPLMMKHPGYGPGTSAVWSPIFIMWLSFSLISTDTMALHNPTVEQRQVEIPHFHWKFRVNVRPSNSSPFQLRLVVAVLATPNDFSVVWGL